MFRFGRLKDRKDKTNIAETKSIDKPKYDIYLETIFNIIKYGDVINLDVKNRDVYEYEEFLALDRFLILDGIEISISQWADWTISIKLIDGKENLVVAQSLVPDSKISWSNSDNFVIGNPKIIWIEEGSWQKVIAEKFSYLEQAIKDTINEIEIEKDRKIKQEENMEKKKNKMKQNYFEDLYREK